jgi:hypothetical protein
MQEAVRGPLAAFRFAVTADPRLEDLVVERGHCHWPDSCAGAGEE